MRGLAVQQTGQVWEADWVTASDTNVRLTLLQYVKQCLIQNLYCQVTVSSNFECWL